jgi:GDP-4-dehydro-6-deoxy-D-mannose reductase
MTHLLLTGATGFIGSRLLKHLYSAGFSVTAVGRRAVNGKDIRNIVVNSLTAEDLTPLLKGKSFDAVVHLAAAGVHPGDREFDRLLQINGYLPSNLVTLADRIGAKALVMAGSNSEYAESDVAQIDERAPLETLKSYGASKAAGGLLAVATGHALGVNTINLRLFNVFGPGEANHRLLPSLVRNLSVGKSVDLSEGSQVRDFLHVDDACRAIITALQMASRSNLATGHYNICTGIGTSVKEFATAIGATLGCDSSLLRFGAIAMRPDDVARVVGSCRRFERETQWRPALTFQSAVHNAVNEMLYAIQHD